MDLVVDTNILFAALIKDGMTTDILLSANIRFFAPEHILTEFRKYEKTILHKTHRNPKEFSEFLRILRQIIRVVPKQEFMHESADCPDKDDIDFIKLAVRLKCPLWSNDIDLKRQHKVLVYTTEELIVLLGL